MISDIKKLEKQVQLLEPDESERTKRTQKIVDYVNSFLEDLPNKSAFEDEEAAQKLDQFYPKEEGYEEDEIFDMIDQSLINPGINMASGGFMAYIPGGGLHLSALADYLTSATDKYAGVYSASPGAARMENLMIRWLCDLIGYGEKSFGHMSSGGSMANLTAIVAARDALKLLDHPKKKVIYFTHQVHHCLLKALRVTGLTHCKLQLVPMTTDYKMDVNALRTLIGENKNEGLSPSLVVASGGTTDLGRVDNLEDIAAIAEKERMWFHVDAAYGGFFLLTETGKKLLKGINRADSVVLDPHKGMFLPYGNGAVLVKNGHHLFESFYIEANYLQEAQLSFEQIHDFNEVSPSDVSPELSRHFRGLRMWLPLLLYGEKTFRAALDEKLLLTQYFYSEVQKLGFKVGPDPELSVTNYRYIPKGETEDKRINAFNRKLTHAVQNDKRIFIASTTIDGVYWMRLAILSFRTHLKHIDMLLSLLKKLVEKNLHY